METLWSGSGWQKARLISGLILFLFAVTHFLNHALGLVSIEAMDAMQYWRKLVTRSWLGTTVLVGALVVHMVLALARISRRKTYRLPAWEMGQIISGLAIPFLLIPHFVATRISWTFLDVNDTYAYELVQLWPHKAWEQFILTLLVWVHACVGLHFWLRLAKWYPRVLPVLFALAVAIPIVSLSGFMVAGRELNLELFDPEFVEELKRDSNFPDAAGLEWRGLVVTYSHYAFYAAALLAILTGLGAMIWHRLRRKVTIEYLDGPTIQVVPGPTLLEISRMHGIPHASVCGGRARCSTCRVRIETTVAELPLAVDPEATTLRKVGAPPDVRLACQIRPSREMRLIRVIRPTATARRMLSAALSPEAQGVERVLAVMFLDVRGFTSMSDDKLPYDVVFILNRLFERIGDVIVLHDGWIDKYLGDGLMAVFGRNSLPDEACRSALRAARDIEAALAAFNGEMASELPHALEIGIGIHAGPMVIGNIGYADSASLTVIGRTVNAAARLEALTKDKAVRLIISREVGEHAGYDPGVTEYEEVSIRGLAEPLEIIPIAQPAEMMIATELDAGRAAAAE